MVATIEIPLAKPVALRLSEFGLAFRSAIASVNQMT